MEIPILFSNSNDHITCRMHTQLVTGFVGVIDKCAKILCTIRANVCVGGMGSGDRNTRKWCGSSKTTRDKVSSLCEVWEHGTLVIAHFVHFLKFIDEAIETQS